MKIAEFEKQYPGILNKVKKNVNETENYGLALLAKEHKSGGGNGMNSIDIKDELMDLYWDITKNKKTVTSDEEYAILLNAQANVLIGLQKYEGE